MEFDDDGEFESARPADAAHDRAVAELRRFFEAKKDRVFYSRQLEVIHERQFFHWITNRALRHLVELGELQGERRQLRSGGSIQLVWHRSFRYSRRAAVRVVQLVEEYSAANMGGALGLQGELLVLEGFAKAQFLLRGRNTRSFDGKTWSETGHDLDFIISRDTRSYGVEVKNTLGYLPDGEFRVKIKLCEHLGLWPVFVVRMLPKTWIKELTAVGGFALILEHQLYPWSHRDLAQRVKRDLGLPVDSPACLEDGTMQRFLRWHLKQCELPDGFTPALP
jgi:hypothetical protein